MGEDGIGAGAYAPQHSSNPVLTPYSVAASGGRSVGHSRVALRPFLNGPAQTREYR
jgi:hypothetical protein